MCNQNALVCEDNITLNVLEASENINFSTNPIPSSQFLVFLLSNDEEGYKAHFQQNLDWDMLQYINHAIFYKIHHHQFICGFVDSHSYSYRKLLGLALWE